MRARHTNERGALGTVQSLKNCCTRYASRDRTVCPWPLASALPTSTDRYTPPKHRYHGRRQVARPNRRTLPNKDSGRRRSQVLRSTSNLNVNALVCAACNAESSSEISLRTIFTARLTSSAGMPGFLPSSAPKRGWHCRGSHRPDFRAAAAPMNLASPSPNRSTAC